MEFPAKRIFASFLVLLRMNIIILKIQFVTGDKMNLFKQSENEIKIKNKYKKIADDEIDRVTKEKNNEIDVIIKRHDEAIKTLNDRHLKALETIRQNVSDELYPIIKEREIEIQRLNKIISVQKQYYESIKNREFELTETIETLNVDYERGFKKCFSL